ncbi:MAG: Gfo/Idh/MocA family oxidoreductase [Candidatus Bathyarchaeia archaeon]
MKTVNIGIIGAGFCASILRLPEYARYVPEAKIIGIASESGITAEHLAKKWGIKFYTNDWRKLLKQDEIDVIDITAPNYLHAEMTIESAEAGKNVIVEKPFATSVKEAEEMVRACEKAGVKLCYAENVVFAPTYSKAIRIASEGGLGKVWGVRHREAHMGPHSVWFWDKKRSGGGAFMDMGCHSIEVCRSAFGKLKTKAITAIHSTQLHSTEMEDNSIVVIEFENGAWGICETSWTQPGGMDDRLEIWGSKGRIKAELLRTGIEVYTEIPAKYVVEKVGVTTGWTFPVGDETFTYGYPQELRHFIKEVILEGKEPIESGKDGLAVMKLIEAGYKSAKDKKRIQVEA